MTLWLNHAAVTFTSSTAGVTVDPSGTAVAGTAFTPTSGRLLVAVIAGAVTSTTPTGWTLPPGGSAVNNTGLYVFYKTAAGGDTFSTVNNGSGWTGVVDFYEFSAGSTVVTAAGQIGVNNGTAGPTLTGLTGSLLCMEASSTAVTSVAGSGSYTWSAGTPASAVFIDYNGKDGDNFGVVYVDNVTTSTWASPSATTTASVAISQERVAFAISVASPSPSLVASYFAATTSGGGTTTTPVATTSFTPSNGEVIVVKVSSWDGSVTLTPSGGGLTYTSWNSVNKGVGFRPYGELFTAVVSGSPGAMTVTATPNTAGEYSMTVERWSSATLDATPVTDAATGQGGLPQSSITTTAANSVVSWSAPTSWFAGSGDPSTNTLIGGAVQEGIRDGWSGGNGVELYAYQAAPTAGAQSYGFTAPTGQTGRWGLLAIEVKYAGAGGGPATVTGASALSSGASLAASALATTSATASLVSASTATITATTSSGTSANLTSAASISASAVNQIVGDTTLSSAVRLTAGKPTSGWTINMISMN